MLQIVREYVKDKKLVAPLSFEELQVHSAHLRKKNSFDAIFNDFILLLLNNETWRENVAAIPFNRRLLLIPKCLRFEEKCPAEFDTIGLICKRCGSCPIGDLLNEAERLGYACMVAEGSPIVMSLIETGKIQAVVGASCMSVLERVFPYMEAGAIPGIAIPLLYDGCKNTTLDLDWLWDAIHVSNSDKSGSLDIESLRLQVKSWFSPESLESIMGEVKSKTEGIAQEWLSKAGKRWRPLLTACTYQALQEDLDGDLPQEIRKIAVAVECFHKASLIHDDIEDNDKVRYGEKTLHNRYGIPVAVNIGDFLIGEGYRLIAESNLHSKLRASMLQAVSEGHRTLSVGQGTELSWAREPGTLSTFEVIDIFRNKTAPAFEVALSIGAIYARSSKDLRKSLKRYSKAIGIAYQIHDDLDDFYRNSEASDLFSSRPSILLSLAYEKASKKEKGIIRSAWRGELKTASDAKKVEKLISRLHVKEETLNLLETYKSEAVCSLCTIENSNLKSLLRRLIGKIFKEIEIMGCCNEHQAENDTGDAQGSGAVA